MKAVDTNILVYAHRADCEFHAAAEPLIRSMAEGDTAWAIPWPCFHEFYSVVTHPRIYSPPSTIDQAIKQIEAWLSSPSLVPIGETDDYWTKLRPLLETGKVAGPMVHDARIAGICANHSVQELLTMDRDFSRFPKLTTRNPLNG